MGETARLALARLALAAKVVVTVAWTTDTPAEAVEALATARLWPWEPGDASAPRWWCEMCHGDGAARLTLANGRRIRPLFSSRCSNCGAIGHVADPPSLPAIVAVASLGAPSLLTAVELAGVLAPGAVVVWRVMTREAIEAHHARERGAWWSRSREYGGAIDPTLPEVFSTEENISHWRSDLRWRSRTVGRAAWPTLRALAVGEGPTPKPTGVHLVALDASRIVLAVEAIGGGRG